MGLKHNDKNASKSTKYSEKWRANHQDNVCSSVGEQIWIIEAIVCNWQLEREREKQSEMKWWKGLQKLSSFCFEACVVPLILTLFCLPSPFPTLWKCSILLGFLEAHTVYCLSMLHLSLFLSLKVKLCTVSLPTTYYLSLSFSLLVCVCVFVKKSKEACEEREVEGREGKDEYKFLNRQNNFVFICMSLLRGGWCNWNTEH